MEESKSYLSYADSHHLWKLDDGSPVPDKKYFKNTSYDPQTRTFRGVCDWHDEPFAKAHRRDYEIVFAEDLRTVVGGIII